ncbi:MAG: L-serine ammonia-lyase, iron-sulfur-dependent subunit beta [Lachnospiraceae bacterium]|jgi:L-serine dehydratase|nr:L-serine ammonia-lyase, iron-sulfur-dependent subunit beta [Lachnospiraceae bacterium]
MDIFEIIGPVMVGPSSSHTAGAVKIGYVAGRLLGEPLQQAEILLYGSFLATGSGHGTDRAIAAGLLGMKPDDPGIIHSLEEAAARGIRISFGKADLQNAHPNTAVLKMTGKSGKKLEIQASSPGGGRISIDSMDGIEMRFSAEYPTLIVRNQDEHGLVAAVTKLLDSALVNIAEMQVYRDMRGGQAVMTVECDAEIPDRVVKQVEQLKGVLAVIYYGL